MAVNQCMSCGRLYEVDTSSGESKFVRMLPAEKQPAGSGGYATPGHHPPNLAHEHSSGYCEDCLKRDTPRLQFLGPERGAKSMGMTREEAAGHWWWRNINTPKNPRGRTKEEREREPDGD